jgi:signal transduction histidine kinase
VEITVDLPPALPLIQVDSDRLLEVLFNLLENALAYTPPGGQIHVSAETDATHAVLWVHVTDTGPCIPDEILPSLFERYWRGDYRQAETGANMGLGLNIVHEILRAHGGVIEVTNLPNGPDFHFSLPIYRDPGDVRIDERGRT